MNFSRQESKAQAIRIKIRRARTMAKLGSPEFKTKHPDWCRDANKGDYTMMDKKIKEQCEKAQTKVETFRSKLLAKD